MNFRYHEIQPDLSILTADTLFKSLKGEDPITAIMVQLRITNGSTTPVGPADRAITRLKLMDGGTPLITAKGISYVPYHLYNLSHPPVITNSYLSGVQNISSFIIPFGRYLHDPEYAFDPSKFTNPQLQIEHNYANGGVTTNTAATLQVYLLMFNEKPSNLRGFLALREIYNYALSSSGVESVDIPVARSIRNLYIQSLAAGKAINSQYNSLKLTLDSDKKIFFDESTSNLVKLLFPHPQFVEGFDLVTNGTTQRLHYGYNCYESVIAALPEQTDDSVYDTYSYGPNIDLRAGTTCNVKGIRSGYAPNAMMRIPFGRQDDPSDWGKFPSTSKLELRITAGSSVGSSSTCEVLIQEEHLY